MKNCEGEEEEVGTTTDSRKAGPRRGRGSYDTEFPKFGLRIPGGNSPSSSYDNPVPPGHPNEDIGPQKTKNVGAGGGHIGATVKQHARSPGGGLSTYSGQAGGRGFLRRGPPTARAQCWPMTLDRSHGTSPLLSYHHLR